MVLLEIHTDCQTSSGKNVQRVMKIPREKEGGKTNIVCVYIYMASLRGRGGQGKDGFFFFFELLPSPSPPMYIASERWPRKGSIFFFNELPPSPSPPIYSPPIYIDGLAFSL